MASFLFPPPRRPVPARVFAALHAETKHRGERALEAWIRAERLCVLAVVNEERAALGKAPVTEGQVERAEWLARGHVDYLWQYAYAAENLVTGP